MNGGPPFFRLPFQVEFEADKLDGLVKSLQNANSRIIEVNHFKRLQSRKLRFSTFYETIKLETGILF
jgi:hypothetical protein